VAVEVTYAERGLVSPFALFTQYFVLEFGIREFSSPFVELILGPTIKLKIANDKGSNTLAM
jgi:hypothetical protein